jgi:arylsulfatase A
MRFTDCHSAGTVCSPSRAGLLTGRNPYRLGLYYVVGGGSHLRASEITIATLLKNKGYDTCFVGKWHLSRFVNKKNNQPSPGDHGFDHWFATEVNAFEGPQHPQKFYRNGQKVGPVDGWYCDVIVREAIDWLNNRPNKDKPFFLVISTHEPHTPLMPPDRYAEAYDNVVVDSLEKMISYGAVERPKKDISHLKKYYYGTVSQLDQAFGNFIKSVDNMGYRDNSLVFFTSDNGPEAPVNLEESRGEWEDESRDRCFGTPGPYRGMKRYPYEGGHRVPGIIRWPGHSRSNSTSSELVNGTDVLPTFCSIAGVPVPQDRKIDGEDVTAIFEGKTIKRTKSLCWFFPAHEDTYYRMPHVILRENEYTLLASFNIKPKDQLIMDWIKNARLEKFALYNLHKDIRQDVDLCIEEPGRFEKMKAEMIRYWRDVQTEGPYWHKWKMK